MNTQKQKLLDKIHEQLQRKKEALRAKMPVVHKIDDGLVIRFFSDWEKCEDNTKVRYVEVESDVEGEKIYKFYLPKGTNLDIKKREYAGCIICLEGHLVLDVEGELVVLTTNTKRCLSSDVFEGKVLKDSYVLTRALPPTTV